MRILLAILLLFTSLFSFDQKDFSQLYSTIDQRIYPNYTLLIITDDKDTLFVGARKKDAFASFKNSFLEFRYEPGKTLVPLLLSYFHTNIAHYFYSNQKIANFAKDILQKSLQNFFDNYNIKANLSSTPKHKAVLSLGYGLLVTPIQMLTAYKEALQRDKALENFLRQNAKNFYNIFYDHLGLIGTISHKTSKRGYGHHHVLSYYGFIDKNSKRYYFAFITQFHSPTSTLSSKNFGWIVWDIIERL